MLSTSKCSYFAHISYETILFVNTLEEHKVIYAMEHPIRKNSSFVSAFLKKYELLLFHFFVVELPNLKMFLIGSYFLNRFHFPCTYQVCCYM